MAHSDWITNRVEEETVLESIRERDQNAANRLALGNLLEEGVNDPTQTTATGDYDPGLGEYLGRFSLDKDLLFAGKEDASLESWRKIYGAQGDKRLEGLNSRLDQAETAFRAGNFDQAKQFRSGVMDEWQGLGDIWNTHISQAYNYATDPEVRARFELGAPDAQRVRGLVSQGRKLQDTSSSEYNALQSMILDPVQENIARNRNRIGGEIVGGQRAAQAEIGRAGLRRGGARSVNAEFLLRRGSEARAQGRLQDLDSLLADQSTRLYGLATTFLGDYGSNVGAFTDQLAKNFAAGRSGSQDLLKAQEAVDLESYLKEINLGDIFNESTKARLEQENFLNNRSLDTGVESNSPSLADLANRDFG